MKKARTSHYGALPGLIMIAPYLILLVAFGVVPIGVAFTTSMRPSLRNPDGGLLNYLVVLQDFRFLPALGNVAFFLAIYVPVMLLVVSILSLLLDAIEAKAAVPLRAAYIVPASIAGSVAILVWYFMLEPTFSPFSQLFEALGITQGTQIWSTGNLVFIFVLMAFFTGAGNWIVVQYGSLQSISDEILEAARIDGANGLQTALQIKLPLMRPYLIYMAILTFAAGLQIFVEPFLISSSVYPGLADNWSLNQLAYSMAFDSADLGSAAALSLILLLICLIVALFTIFSTGFFDEARKTEGMARKKMRRRAAAQEGAM